MTIDDTELLTAITPTEAVLLYADLVVKPYPSPSFDQEGVPTSGQGVYGEHLVDAAMVTLVAAVISGGVIPTVEVKPWLIFWKTSRIHLRLRGDTSPWPAASPEARLVDWLRQRPGQSGGFEAAAIDLFMPKRDTNVWRSAYQSLHGGLLDRGYVERKVMTVLKVLRKERFVVSARHHQALTKRASLFERSHLTLSGRLSDEVQRATLKSWRHAISMQNVSLD